MPYIQDQNEYRRLAEQWRTQAEKLQVGETRDSYLEIAEGYERLAEILERRRTLQPSLQVN
jgi:hypothetical protein